MSRSVTIYTRKDVDEMLNKRLKKALEPYRILFESMHIRLIDVENIIKRMEKRKK